MPRRTTVMQLILDYYQERLGSWVHNQTLRNLTGQDEVTRICRSLRQLGWEIEAKGGFSRLVSLEKGQPRGEWRRINHRVRRQALKRDNFACITCGARPEHGAKLVVGRKKPMDWGGGDDLENLETRCAECSRGRQAALRHMTQEELSQYMAKIA